MTAQKYEELEKQFYSLQNILWKIEWAVENIQAVVWWIASIKDVVITQQEKHKVSENRLEKIEVKMIDKDSFEKQRMIDKEAYDKLDTRVQKQQEAINWINLKIAMVSWAWAVAMLIISKI